MCDHKCEEVDVKCLPQLDSQSIIEPGELADLAALASQQAPRMLLFVLSMCRGIQRSADNLQDSILSFL